MTTAISVYTSGGLAGRCDGKCHEAAEPACDCICGGRLHGAGERAIEMQTADYFGSLEAAEAWAKRNGLERAQFKTPAMRRRQNLDVALHVERECRAAEGRRLRRLGIVPGQISLPLSS
jgi:hypothetical protein